MEAVVGLENLPLLVGLIVVCLLLGGRYEHLPWATTYLLGVPISYGMVGPEPGDGTTELSWTSAGVHLNERTDPEFPDDVGHRIVEIDTTYAVVF